MPKPSHSRSSSNEPALGKELFLQVWPILSRWIVQNDLGAVPASLALWWEMAVGRHHGQAVGRHGQAHSSLEPIDRTATDFMPPLVMEAWQCVHHWMSEVIEARKVVAADRFFKRHLLHHAFSVWVENTDFVPSLVSGTNSEVDALVEPEGASDDDTTDSSDSGHADQDAKIARLQKIIEETDKVLADIAALQEKIKAITATGPEPAVGGSAGPVLGGPEPAIGGSVPNWSDCTSQEFLDNAPHCNILLAGFPCQPWSVAGKGQGKNDVRGRAAPLTGIIMYIEKHHPELVMLENVAGLFLRHRNVLSELIVSLENMHYYVSSRILNSRTHSGIPHRRSRLYILAFKLSSTWPPQASPGPKQLRKLAMESPHVLFQLGACRNILNIIIL